MLPEQALLGLILLCWGWRFWSVFYSSYSIADVVTLKSQKSWPRSAVAGTLVVLSLLLQLTPSDWPLLRLANKFASMPSEMYTLYFAHRYVGPAVDSRRFTMLLYFLTMLSIFEIVHSIHSDLQRLR